MKTTLEDQPVEGGGIALVDGVEDESTQQSIISSVTIVDKTRVFKNKVFNGIPRIRGRRKMDEEGHNKKARKVEYTKSPKMMEDRCRILRNSDLVNDFSTYQCERCDYSGQYRFFLKHIDKEHMLTSSQYKAEFGSFQFDELVHHTCKLCGMTVVYIWDRIFKHLKSHNITLKQYNQSYLTPKKSGAV